MSKQPTKINRDANRQNMASSIVQANIYSNIVQEGLKCISDITTHELNTNTTISQDSKRKFESILSVTNSCIETSSKSSEKYQKCSTYIKRGSVDIANREVNMVKKAISNNENPSIMMSIHHYEPTMSRLQSNIYGNRPNSKCHPSQPISTSSPDDEVDEASVGIQSVVRDTSSQIPTNTSTIPHPDKTNAYHSPLRAVQLVNQYANKQKQFLPDFPSDNKGSHWRKLSKNMIMKYMIKHLHVPIKITAFRKLIHTHSHLGYLSELTWTELTAPGRKPHLPNLDVQAIINQIHSSTQGGNTVSRRDIQDAIQSEIKKRWSENSDERYRFSHVPTSTMNRYVHKIMSNPKFNIQTAVSNKTESRSAAEWSVRSTISYALVVLASHFVRAEPSPYHPKMNSLDPEISAVWELVEETNNKSLSIDPIDITIKKLIPVLPQLVTSTDETTLFITSHIINNKEVWFLFAKACENSTVLDSSKRDNYSTTMSGDAHCRGLRITLNNTFTAGGRVAPAFVCVYGLTPDEMPGDEIILVPIEGLVIGSDQNGSMDKGYICFIRGKYDGKNKTQEEEDTVSQENDNEEEVCSEIPASKEARVAQLYRETVYYPFIHSIRTKHYRMPESDSDDSEVPTNLTAVCWMDGCYGQLNLTTREDVLEKEAKMKIVCNKHSAARTAVEQAADVGPMFKLIKQLIRYMKQLRSCHSPIYQRIVDALDELRSPTTPENSKRIVRLESHKRKAIIAAMSKLPSAMGAAFSPSIVTSAFEDNGQIDRLEGVIPSIKDLIGTYRGSISKEHYLNDSDSIVRKFYHEVFTNGRIQESSFDKEGVAIDVDSEGNKIDRDFSIVKENCQRAKVLSAKVQRLERIKLVNDMKEEEHQRKIKLYTYEDKKYAQNKECENRLVLAHKELNLNTNSSTPAQVHGTITPTTSLTFTDILPLLTVPHFGKHIRKGNASSRPTKPQLSAFIQVRQPIRKFKGRYPQYQTMKSDRALVVEECLNIANSPPLNRLFEYPTR